MKIRIETIYSGRVQGVGFRATCVSIARGYRVTGTVQNLNDGNVVLIAEGIESEVNAMLAEIRQRFANHIRDESSHLSQATGEYSKFEFKF